MSVATATKPKKVLSEEGKDYWVRSGALTLLEKVSGLVFSVGTSMILWRELSKEGYSSWGIFLIIAAFIEMGRSGLLQNGLVSFLTTNRQHPEEYKRITTVSFIISVGFSILTNLILWFGINYLASKYNAPILVELIPIYFLTNFVMIFYFHFNFVQQANFEFRGIFWATFCFRGSLFFYLLFCFLTKYEIHLPSMAIIMLVGAVAGAVCSWIYARPFLRYSSSFDRRWFRKLLDYGKYSFGTNISTMFYKNIDKLTLSSLMGPAAFAIYDVAAKITQMVEVPSFSIAQVVFPQSAKRNVTEGTEGIKKLYERSVGATLAIILPFVAVCFLLADWIVVLLAGNEYIDSANVLRLTAIFGLMMPFAVQFGTILDSTGKPNINFFYTFFTAVINLALTYFCISRYGIYGAAVGTLLGYGISFVLMQSYLYKHYNINAFSALCYIPVFYKKVYFIISQKITK